FQLQKLGYANDPIIGVWRQAASNGYDDRVHFYTDGTWKQSFYLIDEGRTVGFSGTWTANGGNSYTLLETSTGTIKTFVYTPAQKGVYDTRWPSNVLSPYAGDIAPASSSQVTPATGSISVSSYPSGALVFVDGTNTGKKTPTIISGIPTGSHLIMCRIIGYPDSYYSVMVNAGKTTTFSMYIAT
ncbi:MAG: PEGA domain-containing protein, partial [Methanomicrobiales archaeon]